MHLSFAFTTLLASASASTLSALSKPIGAECGVFRPCDEGMACESGGTCVKNAEKETMLGKHSSTYTPTNLPQGMILGADPDVRANRQLWAPFGIGDRKANDGGACGTDVSCHSGSWCTADFCSSGKEGQTCAHGAFNADCNTGLSCVSNGHCARNAEEGASCGDSAGNVDCVEGFWCNSGTCSLTKPLVVALTTRS